MTSSNYLVHDIEFHRGELKAPSAAFTCQIYSHTAFTSPSPSIPSLLPVLTLWHSPQPRISLLNKTRDSVGRPLEATTPCHLKKKLPPILRCVMFDGIRHLPIKRRHCPLSCVVRCTSNRTIHNCSHQCRSKATIPHAQALIVRPGNEHVPSRPAGRIMAKPEQRPSMHDVYA